MAAGRVTHKNDPLKIEMMLGCEFTDKVGRVSKVFVRSWPATAIIAEPSILDIPSGNSILDESSGEGSEQVQRRCGFW